MLSAFSETLHCMDPYLRKTLKFVAYKNFDLLIFFKKNFFRNSQFLIGSNPKADS